MTFCAKPNIVADVWYGERSTQILISRSSFIARLLAGAALTALASAAPVGAPSASVTSRTLSESLAARRVPTASSAWQRVSPTEAARNNSAERTFRYSAGIRATLISWTGHWSTPTTQAPPDGTVEPPPTDTYRPPEGAPDIPAVVPLPTIEPVHVIPTPGAALLGLIGLVMLVRRRDLRAASARDGF